MKKRTKIELVLFAVVAVFFILGLIRDMPSGQAPEPSTTVAAVIEAPTSAAETETSPQGETDFIAIETMQHSSSEETESEDESAEAVIDEDGTYTDKESVALYIHTYGHLPSNYITKSEARDAGWDNTKGNLDDVCPGMSIGGDYFGNYEDLLPKKKGRKYFECDIDYNPKKGRGAKRIIFSNDGLIYYTKDHYESFELLYGEP